MNVSPIDRRTDAARGLRAFRSATRLLLTAVGLALAVCPAGAEIAFNAAYKSSVAGFGRGVWMWSDGTREYALVCKRTVLKVVDVTNRATPQVLADVPTVGFDLKEVRAYDHYAYAINQSGPMQIIDLSDPANIRTVATYETATVPGAHTIEIDGHYAYLSLWGVGPRDLRILDLSDPLNPVEVGHWRHPDMPLIATSSAQAPATRFESCGEHAETLRASGVFGAGEETPVEPTRVPDVPGSCGVGCACSGDQPADLGYQPRECGCGCVNPDNLAEAALQVHDCFVRGDRAYVALITGGFAILDVSDKSNPQTLALVTYPDALCHSMWASADGKFLFTTDERLGGHLRVWNVQKPTRTYQVGEYRTGDERMIHNVYVSGDLAYLAYYTDGLRVLDVTDPREPAEIAFYDTYSGPLGGYFAGAWSAVASALDGAVFVSDMSRGLLVIQVDPGLRAGHFHGWIHDDATGEPLAGATVRSVQAGLSATTDDAGAFDLRLGAGQHTMVAERYGHRPDTVTVQVAGGLNAYTSHTFRLDELPWGRLRVYVTDASGLVPVADAAVVVTGLPPGRFLTGVDGITDAGVVPARDYTARIGHFGHTTTSVTLLVPPDSSESAPILQSMLPISYVDDARYDQGWSLADPDDDATAGRWLRDDANPSWWDFGIAAPDLDADGQQYGLCFQTGYGYPGLAQDTQDLDGGKTTLTSPRFRLDGFLDPTIRYYRWFTNNTGANPNYDPFRVEISNDGGETWTLVEQTTATMREWTPIDIHVRDFVEPSASMRLRFIAEDRGGESVVEALVDRLSVSENPVVSAPGSAAPAVLALAAPQPNPAVNGAATVRFRLPRDVQRCRVDLVDVRGRVVSALSDGPRPAGEHSLPLRAGVALAPGLYWIHLSADGEVRTQRFVVLAR